MGKGKDQMKLTADSNVLIRAAVQDDVHQARRAAKILAEADLVAVPVTVLCEFVWVLRRGYKRSASDVSDAIRRLMKSANVAMNRPGVEAGLSVLDSGGDFADGVIAYEGEWLGADEFVSFDSKAVSLLQARAPAPGCCRNGDNQPVLKGNLWNCEILRHGHRVLKCCVRLVLASPVLLDSGKGILRRDTLGQSQLSNQDARCGAASP